MLIPVEAKSSHRWGEICRLKRTDVKLDRKNNQIIDSINDVYKKSLYIIRQTQEKVIKIRENILEVIKWIGLSKMRWM